MKKFIPIFFLSCLAFCQEIATTESGKKVQLFKNGTYKVISTEAKKKSGFIESDLITLEGQVKSKRETIYILNGDEQLVDCKSSFSSSENRYSKLGLSGINSMIETANIKVMFQMKNRRTYIPKKISCFFSDNSTEWIIAIEFVSQNDYGATKDGKYFVSFDELGVFKNLITFD